MPHITSTSRPHHFSFRYVLQAQQAELAAQVKALKADLDKVKAEKKAQKQEIQRWLDGFKAKYGCEAAKEDKEQVRPLFNRYRELEKRVKDMTSELDPLEVRLLQMTARSLADIEPRIAVRRTAIDADA